MQGSLQDQLLGAGLIKKQDTINIKTTKEHAVKQSRVNNTELSYKVSELAEKSVLKNRVKAKN